MGPGYSKEVDVYQAYVNAEQFDLISPCAIPYDASHNNSNDTREYELFKEIFEKRGDREKPWGLLSSKFELKTGLSLSGFLEFAVREFSRGCEFVFINPFIGHEAVYLNVWEQGVRAQPGMKKILGSLGGSFSSSLGLVSGVESFSFCNYFLGTPFFWRSYFRFVDSVTDFLDAEAVRFSEAGKVWKGEGNYRPDPSATMRPFVIERLFFEFIRAHPSMRRSFFQYEAGHYEFKFGARLGMILWELSGMKAKAIKARDLSLLREWKLHRKGLLGGSLHGAVVTLDNFPLVWRELSGDD